MENLSREQYNKIRSIVRREFARNPGSSYRSGRGYCFATINPSFNFILFEELKDLVNKNTDCIIMLNIKEFSNKAIFLPNKEQSSTTHVEGLGLNFKIGGLNEKNVVFLVLQTLKLKFL